MCLRVKNSGCLCQCQCLPRRKRECLCLRLYLPYFKYAYTLENFEFKTNYLEIKTLLLIE